MGAPQGVSNLRGGAVKFVGTTLPTTHPQFSTDLDWARYMR